MDYFYEIRIMIANSDWEAPAKDASPNSARLLSYFASKTWTSFAAMPRAQIMPTAPQKSNRAVLK